MARVQILQPREQAAHFGLYRTSAGGDDSIIVRRKVADPTDYRHTKSRKLKRQREALALASYHYAQLTPSQKAHTRHQFEEVEYQKSHGKTDTKLLMGRQLYISKEIRSLATAGQPLYLPHELCIMLVDEFLNPLEGTLTLKYLDLGEWWNIQGEQLALANWLFSLVPRGMESYRPYGEAVGFYDPQLPEHQNMTENEIRLYHYHTLLPLAPPELFEYYHGESVGPIVQILYLHGEVFTPQVTHELTHIVAKARRYNSGTTLHVCLANVKANKEPDIVIVDGIPSGFLAQAQLPISTWSSQFYEEKLIPLQYIELAAGKPYALVYWSEDPWPNGFQIRADHVSPAGYPRGYEVYYRYHWVIYDGIEDINSFDMWFEEWGRAL